MADLEEKPGVRVLQDHRQDGKILAREIGKISFTKIIFESNFTLKLKQSFIFTFFLDFYHIAVAPERRAELLRDLDARGLHVTDLNVDLGK